MQLLKQLVEDAHEAPVHPPGPQHGKRLVLEETLPENTSARADMGNTESEAAAAAAADGTHSAMSGLVSPAENAHSPSDEPSSSTSDTSAQAVSEDEHAVVRHVESRRAMKRKNGKTPRRKKKHANVKRSKLPADSALGFGARTSVFSPANLPGPVLAVEPSEADAARLHFRAAQAATSPSDDDLVTNAFADAAAARAETLAEVKSLRDRVGTAWMNPEAHFGP
jgi:hypothetical protein